MSSCKNCGTQLIDNYCHHCGQKASTKRIEMKWLLHELPHAVWHMEKGFLYNVIELFKRPGYAIVDYIEGKRKNFFQPISYLLIMLAAMYFITHYLGIHWYDPIKDGGMDKASADSLKKYDKSQQLFTQRYFEFMAIYLPLAAFIAWLILRCMGRKYNYAESLIVAIFMTSQGLIPQIIVFFIASLVDQPAFTRAADKVGMALAGMIVMIQFFQLGDLTTSKTRRLIVGLIGTAILFAWTFAALHIQTIWLHKAD